MKRLLLVLALLSPAMVFADAPPSTTPEFQFPDLVKQRKELLVRSDFDGFAMEHAERAAVMAAVAAWKDHKGDQSLAILGDFLKKYPASIRGIRSLAEVSEAWAAISTTPEHKARFAATAKRLREIQASLMQSMLDSGDGKTEKTAYPVLEVSEEYELVAWLHLKPQKQSLLNNQANGRSYDVLTLTDETGKTVALYFDITNLWAAENRMFSNPPPKSANIPKAASGATEPAKH